MNTVILSLLLFLRLSVFAQQPGATNWVNPAQTGFSVVEGQAWLAILGRSLDRPLINLGFSGTGVWRKRWLIF